jgi:hypothetical protein
MTFPSDQKTPLVEVFYQLGDPPFVCGLHGCVNGDMIEMIERDLQEDAVESEWFLLGDGTYLYEASWVDDQRNEEGRIELPGYWDLRRIAYRRLDTPSQPA